MSIDVTWVDNEDMENGVGLVHQIGNQATIINMDWEEVNSTISLLIAYRELKDAKGRVKQLIEESYMSYGGTA